MKNLALIICVAIVAGGLWFGHAAWRAYHQLVTLNVRDMPLSQVLRKIQWQTWKKMRAQKSLDDVRITLHVTDKPLAYVLDRIGGQAGAHWSKYYAVYDSRAALSALDSALRGDGKLEPAGWTKVAPQAPDLKPPATIRMPGGAQQEAGSGTLFRRTQNGSVFVENGPNGKTEEWSPEELVTESSLLVRIAAEHIETADAVTATTAANRLNGHWTTYFAFSKSIAGIGFMGMRPMMGRPGQGQKTRGTNGSFTNSVSGQTNFPFSFPPPINPNARFANLTPQERVQQARMKNSRSSSHVQSLSNP